MYPTKLVIAGLCTPRSWRYPVYIALEVGDSGSMYSSKLVIADLCTLEVGDSGSMYPSDVSIISSVTVIGPCSRPALEVYCISLDTLLFLACSV
jgi:hypothetical protein